MTSAERAQKLAKAAPPLREEDRKAINRRFRAFLFKVNRTGEVWTTCCGQHRTVDAKNPEELAVLQIPHTPEPVWRCYCAHPLNEYESSRRGTCPWCGAEVTVKELGRTGKRDNLWSRNRAMVLRWWRGALWVIATENEKCYADARELTALPDVDIRAVYRFTPGKAEEATDGNPWRGNTRMDSYREQTEPGKKKLWQLTDPYTYYFDIGKDYMAAGWGELEKSPFRYCRIPRMGADKLIEHLTAACFYPRQLEFLEKLDMVGVVDDLIRRGVKNAAWVNWKTEKPKAFLPREIVQSGARGDRDIGRKAALWKKLLGSRAESTFDDVAAFCDAVEGRTDIYGKLMKQYGVKADRLTAYLQREKKNKDWRLTHIAGIWKDYIRMSEKMGMPLTNSVELLPKGLIAKHDQRAGAYTALCREQEDEENLKQQEKRVQKYLFWDETYLIRPPVRLAEIQKEGAALRHCVASYADRHKRGDTTILFLRRRDRPHTPFVTIEIKGETLIQVRGYRNECEACPDNPEKIPARELYADILTPWLAWVKAGSRRDKNGVPVLPQKRGKKSA